MKFIKKSTLLMLAMGLVLFACNPDNVAPSENSNGNPSLAGAAGDPHPALDTVCQTADTMFLIREDNGSALVDKCYGPAGPRACNPAEMLPWGYLEMVEGYLADTNFIDCNFTMAAGWYCDRNDWEFSIASAFQFDQNGIPLITSDWSSYQLTNSQNKWQLRINTTQLPDPCYDVALRVSAIKLNLFGAVVAGSATTLWGKNRNWNIPSHPANTISPWLQRFCPLRCMETVTPPPAPIDTTTICEVVYKGLTCTNNSLNSTVLHPTTTEAGVVTYSWNTGATTQDITVNPTVTTSYTATISVDGVVRQVVIFNVNVIDVSCTITTGGGGNNGGGNDPRAQFCSTTLDVRYNQSFNIRNYVKMRNGSNVNWNNVRFTYTAAGANNQTNPTNWKLSSFNAGQSVTVTSQDFAQGRGNEGRGEYKVYVYRLGQNAYDGAMTIRVNNQRSSTVTSAKCNSGNGGSGSGYGGGYGGGGNCGNGGSGSGNGGSGSGNGGGGNGGGGTTTVQGVKVCHVPPGNPGGATTVCVTYAQLAQHVTDVCTTNGGGGNSGNGGSGSGSGNGGSGSGNGGGGNCGNGGSGSGNGGYGGGGNGGWGNGGGCNTNGGGGYGGYGGYGGGGGNNYGGGNGHGCGGHTNNCNGHHQGGGCNNGHSGSGGSGSGSNSNGCGSHHGGGCQGNQGGGHPGDMIGACNSNPCL